MTEINKLVPDIYSLVQKGGGWFNDDLASRFSTDVGLRLQRQLGERQERPTLRLSRLGPVCPRSLWCSIHKPELAATLPPWATIKYSYGHIIEALAITLAKASGHEVTGEQDELVLDGIVGHRDCVIDGCTVDVKSASSIAFQKFRAGSFVDNFGYLDQLDGYILAANSDPLVRVKDKGYILAIDKSLGHMCIYEHKLRAESIRARIETYKAIVAQSTPPNCECRTELHQKSGNEKLGLQASYSPYRYFCFPNLRCFLYSEGPVYLTRVNRRPDVKEVDREGQVVYN